MKICTKCKVKQDESCFNKNKTRKDGLHSSCKTCNKNYLKSHYEDNKEYYISKAYINRDAYTDWYKSLKDGKSCKYCGESHPACLQYHHRDSSTKLFTIGSRRAEGIGKQKLLEEIEKCDLICANCHFKLHYEERLNTSVQSEGTT